MIETLSKRELELVTLMSAGMSTAEIATSMSITANTARVHTGNVFKKLGTTSRGQVASMWFQAQIEQLQAKLGVMADANSAMLAALEWISHNQAAAPEVFQAITAGAIAAGGAARPATEKQRRHVSGSEIDPSVRRSALAALVAQAKDIAEDAKTAEGFDAEGWVTRWVEKPMADLGGLRPVDLLGTAEGRATVSRLLDRLKADAYF